MTRQLVVDPGLQPIRNTMRGSQPNTATRQWSQVTGGLLSRTLMTEGSFTFVRFARPLDDAVAGWRVALLGDIDQNEYNVGDPITILVRIRSSITGTPVNQRIGSADASIFAPVTTPIVVTPYWKWHRIVSTVAAKFTGKGAFGLYLSMEPSTWLGQYIDVAEMMAVKGVYNGDFADHTTPGWVAQGTPNNAVSVGYADELRNLAGNPAAWYEAGKVLDGAPLPADGASVDTWMDLSGNGRHLTQPTAANRPIFAAVQRNLLTAADAMVLYANQTALLPGWRAYGTTTAYDIFNSSVRVAPKAGMTGYLGAILPRVTGLTPGETISAEATIAFGGGSAGSVVALRLEFYSSAETIVGGTNAGFAAGGAGRLVVNATVPAGADRCSVIPHLQNYTVDVTDARFDNFAVYRGTAPATWRPPTVFPVTQPVISFDGINDALQTPMSGTSGPIEVYMVQRMDAWTAIACYIGTGSTSGVNLFWTDAQGSVAINRGSAQYPNATNIRPAMPGPYVVSHSVNGIDSFVRTNGGAKTPALTASIGTNALSTMAVGAGSVSGNLPAAVSIAAIVVYEGVHDDTTRKKVEQWLGRRYGITVAP